MSLQHVFGRAEVPYEGLYGNRFVWGAPFLNHTRNVLREGIGTGLTGWEGGVNALDRLSEDI